MAEYHVAQKVEAITVGSKLCRSEIIQEYQEWVKDGKYDQDMATLGFAGPSLTADYIATYFPNNKDDVFILDVAAGTGKVGIELLRRGFSQIDALDPCSAMLNAAKERQIYRDYISAEVNGSELDIPDGTYDAITCVGGIADGHLPAESVTEMLRLIKNGGIIVLTGNAGVWRELPEYSVKMAAIIKGLEKSGKLCVIKEEISDNYRFSMEKARTQGITIVMKKL
ncbi:methyltransferase-like protein 27 [Liolophura sinensis]|uniref:methyltransferase-like protein 27 n=1 Tax=Liolophura sinensis TaxID=3198878 RepID=UPI003158B389